MHKPLLKRLELEHKVLKSILPQGQETGESINITDSSNFNFEKFNILGNSKQDGEPSLENKVDIKSAGEDGNINFKIMNKNILEFGYKNSVGITFDKNKIIVKNPTDYSYANPFFLQDNESLRNKKIKITTHAKGKVEEKSGFIAIGITGNSAAYQRIYNKNLANEDGEIDDIYCQTIDLQDKLLHSILFWTPSEAPLKGELELNVIIEIVDEIDSVSSEFVEHEEQKIFVPVQEPFRAIDNLRDTFIKQNNKWYEKHNILEFVLNGTQTLNHSDTDLGGLTQMRVYTNIENLNVQKNSNIMCDKLKAYQGGQSLFGEQYTNACAIYDDNHLQIKTDYTLYAQKEDNTPTKISKLTNYLKENNIKFYLKLEEPNLIECNEEQTKILNKIEEDLHTYKNVTNIFSADEVSPVFEVEYIKDLETILTKG